MDIKIFGVTVPLDTLIPVVILPKDAQITQSSYMGALFSTRGIPASENAFYRGLSLTDTPANLHRWTVTEKATYNGAWAKRVRKYAKLKFGLTLTSDPLSRISEHLSKASVFNSKLFLRFTKTLWKAGEFGDAGSCWWGSSTWKHCSSAIMEEGGGLQFFTADERPRGRVWFQSLKGGEEGVIFNVYDIEGRMTLLTMCRILSSLYGISYLRVQEIYMPDGYINGRQSSAFLLGMSPVQRPITLTFASRLQKNYQPIKMNMDAGAPMCERCHAEAEYICGRRSLCETHSKDYCSICGDVISTNMGVCDNCSNRYWKCCMQPKFDTCVCGKKEVWNEN